MFEHTLGLNCKDIMLQGCIFLPSSGYKDHWNQWSLSDPYDVTFQELFVATLLTLSLVHSVL
jgi:hypothetical protein